MAREIRAKRYILLSPAKSPTIQNLRNPVIIISTCFLLAFITNCTSPISAEKTIEQKALYIADNIDSNSLNLLRDFSYGSNGEDNFWLRVSGDTNVYVCNFKLLADTAKLSIWRPQKFMQDFSSTFKFDTSIYAQFTFSKVRDKIVKIEMDSSKGDILVKEQLLLTEQIFPGKNPFPTFEELMSIKDKFGFVGSSYSAGMGDFFIFWLSPKFKLLYIPDTLNLDVKSKKYWLDQFKKGQEIKPHWSLIDVYKK